MNRPFQINNPLYYVSKYGYNKASLLESVGATKNANDFLFLIDNQFPIENNGEVSNENMNNYSEIAIEKMYQLFKSNNNESSTF